MITRKILVPALLLGSALPLQAAGADAPATPPVALAAASVRPERIILNLTADPATQMAITWRSAAGLTGQVQYAVATDSPDFVKAPMTLAAATDDATLAVREDPTFHAAYHSAVLKGLLPDTVHAYRVGDGATNIITPLMVYFPLILIFCQRWVKGFGLGSLAALMVPYSFGLMIVGLVLVGMWVAFDIPLGPGAAVEYVLPSAP